MSGPPKEDLVGLISYEEGLALYREASQSREAIVEIGSYKGKSTCFLAAGVRDSLDPVRRVYAIDLWEHSHITYRSEKRKHIVYQKARGEFDRQTEPYSALIVPVQGASLEIAKTWERPIGLLHIDGDHTTKAVLADVKAWVPWVSPSGVIFFHDWNLPRVREGVEKGIDWSIWEIREVVQRMAILGHRDYIRIPSWEPGLAELG